MFRAFSLAAVVAAFAIAVLGSWVRINGAGMTCPDWPLCHGHVIPTFDGGVILEWSHRLVVGIESLLVLGAAISGWQMRARIAFMRPALFFVACVFALQVVLGALTVALANNPPSVAWHWATGMLLLAGLGVLAILAVVAPPVVQPTRAQNGLFGTLIATTFTAFIVTCIGAFVSSSGAGLACLSFPGCGSSVFGIAPGEVLQMIHRIAAFAFLAISTVAAYWAALTTTDRVRLATLAGYALLVLQIMLGIANIVWALPTSLREAHAANAAATFLAFVIAVVFAVLDGTVREPIAARRGIAAMTSGS